MLSLIICSRTGQISDEFSKNLNSSIGVEFEVIVINNSENTYSIFSAYNLGIEKSKFPYLCFIHEDIFFHTSNWGEIIIKYFNEIPNLGCIGVAGATYKSKAPSGWWDAKRAEWALHIIQHFKDKNPKLESIGWVNSEPYKQVAVIDGVFMATKKSFNIKFDDSISGFHMYDLNFSIEINKAGLKAIVSKEIMIEHFSAGAINKEWVLAAHNFHKRFSALLPLNIHKKLVKEEEAVILERFINLALNYRLKSIAFSYWLEYLLIKPFAKSNKAILRRLIQ